MKNYIIPQIRKYQNVDDLLRKNDKSDSSSENTEKLSINELIQENFVCVIGEPGIGKSRLIDEIKNSTDGLRSYKATDFYSKSIPEGLDYCIVDALDEVEGNVFFYTLQSIKDYKERNPKTKVLFTCRKHYVASYSQLFASCKDIIYVELCRLRNEDVTRIINSCSIQ